MFVPIVLKRIQKSAPKKVGRVLLLLFPLLFKKKNPAAAATFLIVIVQGSIKIAVEHKIVPDLFISLLPPPKKRRIKKLIETDYTYS